MDGSPWETGDDTGAASGRPASGGPTDRTGHARAVDGVAASDRRGSADRAGATRRDPAEWAREICLRQLAVRPRTRAELATALRRRGVDDDVAAEVLDRYDEVGLIDDAAFARAWVSSRHHGRGLAGRALAQELRRKGVDGEAVDAALEQIDGETEEATARTLVARKLRGMGSAPPEAVFRRLVGMLARKGYPPGVAIRAVKDGLAARSAEAAEFAELIDADALTESE